MTDTSKVSGQLRALALAYFEAGWHPLWLPAGAKAPPPEGRTGGEGVDLTEAEITAAPWDGNLGLRMPLGVIGIDVDMYRQGGATLKALQAELGELPKTWVSFSGRSDGSGIHFFQVPEGRWITALDGIEIIQRAHRYAVVWPSMHPEVRQYRWWDRNGAGLIEDQSIPRADELPQLPWTWIAYLSRESAGDTTSHAADGEALSTFMADHHGDEQPSYVSGVIVPHFAEAVANGRSRHDTMQHCLTWAMEQVAAQLAPADWTVTQLAAEWTRVMVKPGEGRRALLWSDHRVTEFQAMLRHAVGKVLAKDPDEIARIHDEAAGPRFTVPPPEAGPSGNGAASSLIDVDQAAPLLSPLSFRSIPDPFVIPDTTWHAENLLCRETHGELAGAEKSLKSYLGLILDVGLATGLPVLGTFDVPERQRVLLLIGEGGEGPFLKRLGEVCQAYGINPRELDGWLRYTTEGASVNSPRFITGLRQELEGFGPSLVHLDPWYTYQPSGVESSQLTSVAASLAWYSELCREHGATAWLNHHFNRTDQKGLRQITGAGHAEWVDSWLLSRHREPPNVATGRYRLGVEVGSRQWGGGSWDVDLDIAPVLGRLSWKVAPAAAPGSVTSTWDPYIQIKVEIHRIGHLARKPMERKSWLGRVRGHRATDVRIAFDEMIAAGQVLVVGTAVAGNNRTVELYEVAP